MAVSIYTGRSVNVVPRMMEPDSRCNRSDNITAKVLYTAARRPIFAPALYEVWKGEFKNRPSVAILKLFYAQLHDYEVSGLWRLYSLEKIFGGCLEAYRFGCR